MGKNVLVLILISLFLLSGCSTIRRAKEADELELKVTSLQNQLSRAEQQKNTELERAKRSLEQSLQKEIGEYKARLEMTERGLVITFLAEVFFDSGKDVIRTDGEYSLEKVARVLNHDVPDSRVAIEGHTDSEPIKHSGWKSNWELSSARALSVLHYLIDECEVAPQRLSANGYGQYLPVVSNDTPKGKQQNRRVEIVILPSNINKAKAPSLKK
jgi:chemotaxis protein MotB